MQVTATRRSGPCAGPDEVHAPAEPDALLPRAHALFVCLPSTGDTDGLPSAARLARLPDGAVVVNVGRGPIVDCAETERLRAEVLAEMLNGAARGAPMPHRVDLDRGY